MEIGKRPWGTYEVLYDGEECKVKKIIVNPGESPSYQMHYKRNENWIVVSGEAAAKVDDKLIILKSGDSIFIPIEVKHTICNNSNETPLVFIEVQTGTYFGEDDIVRFEDKYGRT